MTMTVSTATTPPHRAAIQRRLDDYWSGRAADYHAHQISGERAPVDRELWASVFAARLTPASRVLDVGTGSGYLANLLADAGHHVTGIDHSPGMIAAATRASRPGTRFVLGDAHAPDMTDTLTDTVDAVVSRYVLWTLPDPVAAARAWRSLLHPGGVVVAVDATWFPNGVDPDMRVPSADGEDAFARTYDPTTLAALPLGTADSMSQFAEVFRDAGFTSVTVEPLPQVAELDARFGVAPGHESRPHFVVTAR